jgi:hypothetical protein
MPAVAGSRHAAPVPREIRQQPPVLMAMERYPRSAGRRDTVITEITEINTKQDMSRWTRAHEKAPGITWSVIAGPGGTMIIVEHEEDRASLRTRNVSPDALVTAASLTESADTAGAAAGSRASHRKPALTSQGSKGAGDGNRTRTASSEGFGHRALNTVNAGLRRVRLPASDREPVRLTARPGTHRARRPRRGSRA